MVRGESDDALLRPCPCTRLQSAPQRQSRPSPCLRRVRPQRLVTSMRWERTRVSIGARNQAPWPCSCSSASAWKRAWLAPPRICQGEAWHTQPPREGAGTTVMHTGSRGLGGRCCRGCVICGRCVGARVSSVKGHTFCVPYIQQSAIAVINILETSWDTLKLTYLYNTTPIYSLFVTLK